MAVAAQKNPAYAREYETIYILSPQLTPKVEEQVAGRVQDAVKKLDGKLIQLENWGRRKLAYEIERNKRGIFVYARYVGFNDVVAELERNLRLLDSVIRYQTIRTEEVVNIDQVSIDPEEVKYAPVEAPYEEDEDETMEVMLGMAPSRSRRDQNEEEAAEFSAEDSETAEGDASEAADAPSSEGSETVAEDPKPSEGEA